MTICIFPGTFNPFHIAHLKMAQFALEKFNFEKIIFIPAYIPPHKSIDENLAKHRFNMVKLAVKNNSRFLVSDIEYKSKNKSYTIYTVKKIKEQYGISERLNMIIGTDAFQKIKTWHKADELKNMVHFIVFPRGNEKFKTSSDDFAGYSYELANMPKIDVSSTEIRNHEKDENLKEIKEYITKNELYN